MSVSSSISSEEDSSSVESTAIHFEFKIPCDEKMSKEDESNKEFGERAPSVYDEPTQLLTLTDVPDEDKSYKKFGEGATQLLSPAWPGITDSSASWLWLRPSGWGHVPTEAWPWN